MTTRIEKQQIAHADGLWRALCDPRIYTFLDEAPPVDAGAVRDRIEQLQRGPGDDTEIWLNWTAFHDDRIVGYTQATVYPDASAEIAYVFAPAVWGQGVAWTASRQMICELQISHRPTVFLADTETGNIRSKRLLVRLGFHLIRETEADAFYSASPEALSAKP